MNLKIDKCDSKWLINITQKNETNFCRISLVIDCGSKYCKIEMVAILPIHNPPITIACLLLGPSSIILAWNRNCFKDGLWLYPS